MFDVHGLDHPNDPWTSEFYKNNPHRRLGYPKPLPGDSALSLDFNHPEVRAHQLEGKGATLTSFTTNQASRLTFISLALTPYTRGGSPADTLLKSRATKFPLHLPNTSFCGNFSSIGKANPPNTYETFTV